MWIQMNMCVKQMNTYVDTNKCNCVLNTVVNSNEYSCLKKYIQISLQMNTDIKTNA
jgi:hypothetical protein